MKTCGKSAPGKSPAFSARPCAGGDYQAVIRHALTAFERNFTARVRNRRDRRARADHNVALFAEILRRVDDELLGAAHTAFYEIGQAAGAVGHSSALFQYDDFERWDRDAVHAQRHSGPRRHRR